MKNSSKILLSTLLDLEHSFINYEKISSQLSLPFTISFKNSYDLFQIIVSAFSISNIYYDKLYDLLENWGENKITTKQLINEIENII